MAATTALCEALNQGISSGNLVDTKIILYSRRDSSTRVCRPKVLYASSHVLKTVPYFNNREYTATLGNGCRASYSCFSKYSLGALQRPSQKILTRKRSTKKKSRKTTAIHPTVTSRTVAVAGSPQPQLPPKRKKHSVKSTRSVLKKGRS